jgi:hypothetical protein
VRAPGPIEESKESNKDVIINRGLSSSNMNINPSSNLADPSNLDSKMKKYIFKPKNNSEAMKKKLPLINEAPQRPGTI